MEMTGSIVYGPIVYANGADRQSGMQLPTPNLSKFKRLVWLNVMLPIIFFLAVKVFPVISLLEKTSADLEFFKRGNKRSLTNEGSQPQKVHQTDLNPRPHDHQSNAVPLSQLPKLSQIFAISWS